MPHDLKVNDSCVSKCSTSKKSIQTESDSAFVSLKLSWGLVGQQNGLVQLRSPDSLRPFPAYSRAGAAYSPVNHALNIWSWMHFDFWGNRVAPGAKNWQYMNVNEISSFSWEKNTENRKNKLVFRRRPESDNATCSLITDCAGTECIYVELYISPGLSAKSHHRGMMNAKYRIDSNACSLSFAPPLFGRIIQMNPIISPLRH